MSATGSWLEHSDAFVLHKPAQTILLFGNKNVAEKTMWSLANNQVAQEISNKGEHSTDKAQVKTSVKTQP